MLLRQSLRAIDLPQVAVKSTKRCVPGSPRDLDVLVTMATREDPTTFAAWGAARRIEGQGSSSRTGKNVASPVATSEPPVVVEPATPDAATTTPEAEVVPDVRLHASLGRAS